MSLKKSPSGEQGRVARRKGSRFTRPFSGLYLAKHSPRVKVLDAKKSLSEFDRLPLESVLSIIGTLDRQLGTDPWASIRYLSKGAQVRSRAGINRIQHYKITGFMTPVRRDYRDWPLVRKKK